MNTRSKFKAAVIAVTLAAAVFSMTACTSFNNFKYTFLDEKKATNQDVIYIGVFEPKTGEQSQQGSEEIAGIQLANKIYGNVKGAKVELIMIDNQSNAVSAETAIKDLIAMKPTMIIGSYGESNSMIASDYIKKARIPTITPSAINPLITEGNPYYFRACMTDTQRGAGLAMYAADELKAKNVAMVTLKNDSTNSTLAEGFEDKLAGLKGTDAVIKTRISIDIEDTELENIANRIRVSGADVVFMPVGLEKAEVIFKMVEDAGMTDITFLGDPSWGKTEFIHMTERHPKIKVAFPSDQVLVKNLTTAEAVTAETQRFLIEFSKMYGEDDFPTENTSLGYDSYLIAMNAINNAADTSPAEIVKALNSLDNLRCTTGVFTFDKNGNPIRSVNIAKIEDGLVVNAYNTNDVTEAEEMKKIEKGDKIEKNDKTDKNEKKNKKRE